MSNPTMVALALDRLGEPTPKEAPRPDSAPLAIAVAEAVHNEVCCVDLTPLRDANLVIAAVAVELGITESANRPMLASLTNQLRARELLLVLDNCEQVLDVGSSIS